MNKLEERINLNIKQKITGLRKNLINYVDNRFNDVDNRFNAVNDRLDRLEYNIGKIMDHFGIEKSFQGNGNGVPKEDEK